MTGKPDREQRLAAAWLELDNHIRGLADALDDADLDPRNLEVIDALAWYGRLVWASADAVKALAREADPLTHRPAKRARASGNAP